MNDLIAEHIMGWKRIEEDDFKWLCVSNEGQTYRRRETPLFDTLTCHAWQVVEKLYLSDGERLEFSAQQLPNGKHMVAFWEMDTNFVYDAIDESFARAICRAALKKVGHDSDI